MSPATPPSDERRGAQRAGASVSDVAMLRRLEEIGLNASGPANPRLFDGWLLGFTPGRTKRARCINPFFASTEPLARKVAACEALYAAAGLPLIVRITPFAEPAALDAWLVANGYERFDDTLVMTLDLADFRAGPRERRVASCTKLDLYEWTVATQAVRGLSDDQVRRALDRQDTLHLPGCGMVVAQRGMMIAWGMAQVEDRWAGLYNIETAEPHRRAGYGRRMVEALLGWAREAGADRAYLQVTAANAPAIALYRSLGFAEAYRYWYRARREVIEHERR